MGTDSMAESRDERIRRRAYEIWDREGRSHGRHEDHWHQAAVEIDAEDRKGAASEPAETAAAHAPAEPTIAASGRSAGEATRQNGPGNEPAQAATDDAGGAPAGRRKPRTRDAQIKASNAAAADDAGNR